MEQILNTRYPQFLELVGQLQEKDIQTLVEYIQIKFVIPTKKQTSFQNRTPIQELILQAPTWTDEEYDNYLETRQHINKSRLK